MKITKQHPQLLKSYCEEWTTSKQRTLEGTNLNNVIGFFITLLLYKPLGEVLVCEPYWWLDWFVLELIQIPLLPELPS